MKKYTYLVSFDSQTLERVGESFAVKGDGGIAELEFIIPSNFGVPANQALWRVFFKLPGEKESLFETLPTVAATQSGDYVTSWTISKAVTQKAGRLAFSLAAISGNDIQWNSRTVIMQVPESQYQPESKEAEEPYTGRLDALEGSMAAIRGEFAEVQEDFEDLKETATLGTPIPESLVANMTEGRVYIYTGTEPGYTAGHVYYYVGGTLTDGGVYGGTAVDATLTQSGKAADAAAVGAEVSAIKEDLSAISEVINHFDASTVTIGYRLSADGSLYSNSGYFTSDYISVDEGETYTKNSPTADVYHRWAIYDSGKTFVRSESSSDSITIASGESYVRICGAEAEINTTTVVCESASKTAIDRTARTETENASAILSAIAPEKEVLEHITSSGYEVYGTYHLNSGVPVSGEVNNNVYLIPVSPGDKIRALIAAKTSSGTHYAFHSTTNLASCTSDTIISKGRYTDETYNDFTAPIGAACLLISANRLRQCFSVVDENRIQCLGISNKHYHVTKDVSLSVNTGWQTVSVRTIIPSGKKVIAKLTTEATHGTIQVKIGRSGSVNAFNMDMRVGYGTECSFYTTEFVTGILFNVYNVSVAGSATIDIDITDVAEDNVVAADSKNILYKSLGKNLFNKDDVFKYAFFYPELHYSAGNTISGYIPIANGETMACNYTSGSPTGYFSAVLVKDKYSAETVKTSNEQTITNDLGYDCYALWMISSGRNLDTVQIEKSEHVGEFHKYNLVGEYVENIYENSHGKMGALYPDEMEVIDKFIDGAGQTTYKLHFVHISDNHNSKFGNADDFTDNSNAAFLVNTGDMVQDQFSDSFDRTSNLINAMTKPGYITLGNHDVYGAATLQERYDKFFAPIADHNGMTENTKTYYAVDFAAQGVKCIFLDNFDGIDDLATAPINTNGVMSQEQIEWLFAQLDDAITHNYHVCIFMHYAIAEVARENSVRDWYDQDGSGADTVNWLPQTIDAFQRSATVSFTYREVEYSHTFLGYGSFVAYFVGHEHCDIVGTINGYPHQLNVTVARPEGGSTWEGASRIDYAPYVFNYCTVDTKSRHLSVFRVGQQRTVWGTKRDVFTWRYWTLR